MPFGLMGVRGDLVAGDCCEDDDRARFGTPAGEAREDTEFVVAGGEIFARDPLLMKYDPGRSPNFGNAKRKSLLWLLLLYVVYGTGFAAGAGRPTLGAVVDSLFRYSFTSVFRRSTCARSRPFS